MYSACLTEATLLRRLPSGTIKSRVSCNGHSIRLRLSCTFSLRSSENSHTHGADNSVVCFSLEMGKQLWTREQVADRILAGENLVVLHNKVIRVPQSWLNAHPGGALAILHFVGRDATDEVNAFHSDETLRKMEGYEIGVVEVGETGWESLVPPVMSGWVRKMGADGAKYWYHEAAAVPSKVNTELSPSSQILLVEKDASIKESVAGPTLETLVGGPSPLSAKEQARHSEAYKQLHRRIVDAGLYETRYLTGYGPEIVRYTLFATLSALAYSKGWLVTSAVFLGLFWHQLTFTAHDLGHLGVTHNWLVDRLLGIFIADFLGGLSIGWWVDVSVSLSDL